MTLYTLHGFLGLPSDWGFVPLDSAWKGKISHSRIDHGGCEMQEWAKEFNRRVSGEGPHILLGYSLGGRLAMHLLKDNPKLWSGAILISSHPGLKSCSEKDERIASDESWAKRFEIEPWSSVIDAWNRQEVFAGIKGFERKEKNYSRDELAMMLCIWSLGMQEDMRSFLENVEVPILWIAGKKDRFYTELASKMRFCHPHSQVWVAPESGHRVPWETPDSFLQVLRSFLEKITCGKK